MSREEVLSKYFINIELNKEYPDLYYVRKSILRSIESNIPKMKGTVLDVGCGIMPYREFILNRTKEVSSYIGLDFEDALDTEYALGKPDLFWKGDIIPMADNSVDTIIATEFFEHSSDIEGNLTEMKRVLKKDGLLIFTVPFLWNLHLVPYDEYRYTPFSLERHLKNGGFSDISLNPLGGWDASLAQMLAIWYKQRPMSSRHKRFLSRFVIAIIRKLVKMDGVFNKSQLFQDGGMITGISGTARIA